MSTSPAGVASFLARVPLRWVERSSVRFYLVAPMAAATSDPTRSCRPAWSMWRKASACYASGLPKTLLIRDWTAELLWVIVVVFHAEVLAGTIGRFPRWPFDFKPVQVFPVRPGAAGFCCWSVVVSWLRPAGWPGNYTTIWDLSNCACYPEAGADFFALKDPDRVRSNAVGRLQELGFDVELTAREAA